MKYVIVYAHPHPRSFNRAILERVESILGGGGKDYEVRDLYALKFNPVLDASELALDGKAPRDVEREQRSIGAADVVVFIYPVWWWGMPAILKGYIDRIFTLGFAYAIVGDRLAGLLTGKKAIIINTMGSPKKLMAHTGYGEAMGTTTDLGILGFCGIEVVEHRCLYDVNSVDDVARRRMLDDLASINF